MNRLSRSLYLRCLALTAIITVITVIALSIQTSITVRSLVHSAVTMSGTVTTKSLAGGLGGAFKFKKTDAITEQFAESLASHEDIVSIIGVDATGKMIDLAGEVPPAYEGALAELSALAIAEDAAQISGDGMLIVNPVHFGKSNAVVGAVATLSQIEARLGRASQREYRAIGFALILLIALLFFAQRYLKAQVNAPLTALASSVSEIAQGRLDADVAGAQRADEAGQIAVKLLELREKLREADAANTVRLERQEEQSKVVARLTSALKGLSNGDLASEINERFPENYDVLRTDFNAAKANLADTIRSVSETADQIAQGAEQMSDATVELSSRTESQAATLEESSAALEELTVSVQSASKSATQAKKNVAQARHSAEESGMVVERAVEAMRAIETSSNEISQIISVIDEIAFQTNLLALNAGVEAARAGEAGRGFAVVASEVRALAQRTSDAAKDIKELISTSTVQVESGVGLVDQTGEALREIVTMVRKVSDQVEEMANGAGEQGTGIGEINSAVNQLDQVTQQNAGMAHDSAQASQNLASSARDLRELTGRFRFDNHAVDAVSEAAA